MSILAIFTADNVNKQMYETLRKEVDWEHQHPSGLIFHAAAFDDSGNDVHVTDIWESEKDLNNFVSKKLMPIMQDNRVPIPNVEMFQINDVSAYPGIDKYKV